jgi:hypothetical protein
VPSASRITRSISPPPDRRPYSLKQEIFLIGAVPRNARVDDCVAGKPASQQVGEAFLGFGIDAPNKGISHEQDRRSGVALELDIPEPQAVVLRVDGPGRGDDRA